MTLLPVHITAGLWRMTFALFIATASFFPGQPRVFPEPVRSVGLRSIPVLAVLVLMVYWLIRVRFTKRNRVVWSSPAATARNQFASHPDPLI